MKKYLFFAFISLSTIQLQAQEIKVPYDIPKKTSMEQHVSEQ
jgi:hypothetical protein